MATIKQRSSPPPVHPAPPGWDGGWQAPDTESGVSIIFVSSDRIGEGPALHRHPYAETFVLHEGHARFDLGGVQVDACGGEIVVAPAGVPHRFANVGPGLLRMTNIHASPTFITEWL